eukprot:NODE_1222_length_1727_cov_0.486486.p1 type:complete len:332 gc:universal NODE_1222_length_1727_cov_0.486486:67-1062(+)
MASVIEMRDILLDCHKLDKKNHQNINNLRLIFDYQFLANVPRNKYKPVDMNKCDSSYDADAYATYEKINWNWYLERLQIAENAYLLNEQQSENEDQQESHSFRLLAKVCGLDYVGDEYGFPYCPFYKDEYFKFSASIAQKRNTILKDASFLLRPHLGEVTASGYKEYLKVRELDVGSYLDIYKIHKNIVINVAKFMMAKSQLKENQNIRIRFGHGVCLLENAETELLLVEQKQQIISLVEQNPNVKVELNYSSNLRLMRFDGNEHPFFKLPKQIIRDFLVLGTDDNGILPCDYIVENEKLELIPAEFARLISQNFFKDEEKKIVVKRLLNF